jgi:ribosomal protein S12 methylthiotransferase accessory factor
MESRVIQVSFPGGVRVDAGYKGFVIQTDQPIYEGGTGAAPAPFDLFLASLATCAGYFVLVFCRERKIPTDGMALAMRTEKNPETKMISRISIEILLPPGFPEKYKTAVIKAADQCTVKRHIVQPPAFEVEAKLSQ